MKVCYHPGYVIPLPEGHRFPMPKFGLLRAILRDEGLVRDADVHEPEPATWGDLRRVHDEAWLGDLAHGTLSREAERRLGLPWSEALLRRSRLAVQGTVDAVELALEHGIAANLAGGTHHAFAGHGEGFCVFNDVAVAIRVARARGRITRAAVIDLDVHQGNGTAALFADDPDTFTFSMHARRCFPFRKQTSSLDVALEDGADDLTYLGALAAHLPGVLERARPDLVVYIAGVDPVAGDRLGRLALSRAGLHARERAVLDALRAHGVPVALTVGGGYQSTPRATAELHAVAHRVAAGHANVVRSRGARSRAGG